MISIANASQFGNDAFISPHSVINDGQVDVAVISEFSFFQGIKLFKSLFNKKIESCSAYESYSVKVIEIDTNGTEVFYHCDGEVNTAHGSLEIKVLPLALNVLVP